jgi:hypothetical protein
MVDVTIHGEESFDIFLVSEKLLFPPRSLTAVVTK